MTLCALAESLSSFSGSGSGMPILIRIVTSLLLLDFPLRRLDCVSRRTASLIAACANTSSRFE